MSSRSQAPIAVYTNTEEGIEVTERFHDEGFAVSITGEGAGSPLPAVQIFATADEAGRYARKAAYPNANFDSQIGESMYQTETVQVMCGFDNPTTGEHRPPQCG